MRTHEIQPKKYQAMVEWCGTELKSWYCDTEEEANQKLDEYERWALEEYRSGRMTLETAKQIKLVVYR